MSAGGLFVPALGGIADRYGPQAVLTTLCVVPVLAAALACALPPADGAEAPASPRRRRP